MEVRGSAGAMAAAVGARGLEGVAAAAAVMMVVVGKGLGAVAAELDAAGRPDPVEGAMGRAAEGAEVAWARFQGGRELEREVDMEAGAVVMASDRGVASVVEERDPVAADDRLAPGTTAGLVGGHSALQQHLAPSVAASERRRRSARETALASSCRGALRTARAADGPAIHPDAPQLWDPGF